MIDAARFDLGEYLRRTVTKPLQTAVNRRGREYKDARKRFLTPTAEGSALRRELTRREPLLFALIYFAHHLKSEATGGRITFGDAHLDWAEHAKALMRPANKAGTERDAYVAPREMGKSTWHFLLIPAWAAAHKHVKFIAAFADSASQAETHLATFKHELENNELLRLDYPELCQPLKRDRGMLAADRVSLYRAANGFVFAARGIDARTLGLKVGSLRPDYILLDDIEPDEANYSLDSMKKRLRTLQDAILPLNDKARVVLVGTVTMPGSIVHQLVQAARGQGVKPWIKEDGWRAHYYAPIVDENGPRERSIWPDRWKLKRLKKIRHTRAYLKNYANDPMGSDGDYWAPKDFVHGKLEAVTRVLISVDPAVTTKDSSDFTGIAVVGWQPGKGRPPGRGKCEVREAIAVKESGSALRRRVLKMIAADPSIGMILIETNQGGEVWKEIFWGMPVPVRTKHQSVKKEVRAAHNLNHYQMKRVVHAKVLTEAETQMVAFPGAPNDDLVDAVGTGVAYFLDRRDKVKVGVRTVQTAA